MQTFFQSEATDAQRRMLMRLVDATDLSTPETGVTVAAGDLKISKNGAAEVDHGGSLVEIGGGDYYYQYTQAELNTFGFVRVRVLKSGIAPSTFFGQVVANSPYAVLSATVPTIRDNQAQAGTASTITLDASASAVDDFYNGCFIYLDGGLGVGQVRQIIDYVGSTKVATVYIAGPPEQGRQWTVTPDSTSQFQIFPFAIQPAPLNHAAGVIDSNVVNMSQAGAAKFFSVDSGTTYGAAHAASIVKQIADNAGGSSLTITDIANGVWNKLRVENQVPGSFGEGVASVRGNITGSLASLGVGAIGSVAFQIGAIDAPALTTAALQAIQSGVATASALAALAAKLPIHVTKGVAFPNFSFVMKDSTNHAPLAGLTVSASRSLDGAAFAACANSVVGISNGWYKIDLAITDLDAAIIALRFTATGADDTNITIITQNP